MYVPEKSAINKRTIPDRISLGLCLIRNNLDLVFISLEMPNKTFKYTNKVALLSFNPVALVG